MTLVMLAFMVLSYNHPQITSRTLKSLSNFSEKNIYLVHNGSDWKHIQQLRKEFPNIQHIVIEKNKGFTGGANLGLKKIFAYHEWCFFLTNDCELLRAGELPSAPALIAPRILVRNTLRVDSLGGTFDPKQGKLTHCRSTEDFLNARVLRYVPGTSFLIHKEVFEKTKGFDENLFMYWEDVDFSQKVSQAHYPILVDQNWVIRHGIGKTCHKDSLYTIYYFQRNRKKISYKYSRSILERSKLAAHLSKDWARLSLKLIRSGRAHDLKLLGRALVD